MGTFGEALEAVKCGRRAAREGWNGKNMWIALKKGVTNLSRTHIGGVHHTLFTLTEFEAESAGVEKQISEYPCIQLRAADGLLVTGWLASQTDMLAEDWIVLPKI